MTLLELAIEGIMNNCALIDILHFKYFWFCVCASYIHAQFSDNT